jgi:hypothetical protein
MVARWNQINRANKNDARPEANRRFKNKKRGYLKDKINKLATQSKKKNRGIN